jgi:hypothetical protein
VIYILRNATPVIARSAFPEDRNGLARQLRAVEAEVPGDPTRDDERPVIAGLLNFAAQVDQAPGDTDPALVWQLADEREAITDRPYDFNPTTRG